MTAVINRPSRLRDALTDNTARGREIEIAMATHFQRFTLANNLSATDIIKALAGGLVNVVIARSSGSTEAKEIGEEVCAAIMRRLTPRSY